MKKLIIIALLLITGSFIAQAQMDESAYTSKKFKIGETVTNLVGKSPDGKEMNLQTLNKGRYVIVDFWASWCKPCRLSNPQLVKGYNALKGKKFKNAPAGIAIASVSLDMNVDHWKEAIKKDKLSWDFHISDLKGWSSQLAAEWGIEVVPQVFLLDPNGKLLGVYLSAEKALDELKKYKKK